MPSEEEPPVHGLRHHVVHFSLDLPLHPKLQLLRGQFAPGVGQPGGVWGGRGSRGHEAAPAAAPPPPPPPPPPGRGQGTPAGGGGEGPDDGGEGDLPEDGETQEEEEGVNHQEIPPVRVHFLHGRSTNMGIRRVEEDEDDTIYTLPDDTQEDSPPPRSTHTGGGYRYDAAPRRRADGHNDENVGDDDDRASNPADRTDGLFHPRDTRRNFNYQDSSSRRNRQDSAPPSGDNTLKSDISDSNNSKSRKYDVGKSPRRRGSGGGRGSKNRYRTDADTRTRQGYSRKLPNGLIIGVKKGGTRALLEFLRVHPDIRAPGPEPHFFDRNYEKGLEWYR